MQTGSNRGMQTLEQALADFVVRGLVTEEIALNRSSRPEQLAGLLKRDGAGQASQAGLRVAE